MTNSDYINNNDLINESKSYEMIENVASLIEDFGENFVVLHNVNNEIEKRRILDPIAIRKDRFTPYKFGLIDKNYKIIAEPEYDVIVDEVIMRDQLIRVGKTVPIVYDEPQGSGVREIQLREKFGVIDAKGKIILKPTYDEISFYENFKLIAVSNGPTNTKQGSGLFDGSGKQILPVGSYYKIYGFCKGLARVIKGNKWGIINTQGKLLFPVICDNIWSFEGKDYDSIIVEKDGVRSQIAFDDIINGKFLSTNNYNVPSSPFYH